MKATLDLAEKFNSMDKKLDNIQSSINNLSVFVKMFNNVFDLPCTFIIVPREEDKESKSFFSLSGMKSRLVNAKDKVLKSNKMLCQVTIGNGEENFINLYILILFIFLIIVFICDGCELDSKTKCNRLHKGFNCDLPGENLRKMAPALILMGKYFNLFFNINMH